MKAFTSTRLSGYSSFPFHYTNLGFHAGDKANDVMQNRDLIMKCMDIPTPPVWLCQTHSNNVVDFSENNDDNADASITRKKSQVLVVLTADCLPIIITNHDGSEVAAIHAGWRGLCNGIIENTINKMDSNPNNCIAWIGPGICGHCFEVGEEVCLQFENNYAFSPRYCFLQKKWHIHLNKLAAHIMRHNGIFSIHQSNMCTFEQKNLFYSYRRDGQTGRIGTFIWFE